MWRKRRSLRRPRSTRDIDLTRRQARRYLARLSQALKEPGARIRTEAVRYEQRSEDAERSQVIASDDEQVQVPAYGRQRLGADAAQVTAGSLIGHGTDLLGHGERDLS